MVERPVERYLLEFARGGPARYLSHLDTARALQRTFARAGLAPALTRGLRPKPRLSLGLPLPVGAAAVGELAVVDLPRDDGETECIAEMVARLQAASSPGLEIVSLERCSGGFRLRPTLAVYEWRTDVACELVDAAVRRFAAGADASVARSSPKGSRRVDLHRYVTHIEVRPWEGGACLRFAVRHRADGAARPAEVLAHVLRGSEAGEADGSPWAVLATALFAERGDDLVEGASHTADDHAVAQRSVRVIDAELIRLGVVYDGLAPRGLAQEWLETHAVQEEEEGSAGDAGTAA